jgi:pSer/pThr/pTyr-binding forkhead associated (FHA) protein
VPGSHTVVRVSTWECVSCGATEQAKVYCEACGAAQPMDGVDTALSLVIGRVCTSCDAYNDPGVTACASCGAPIVEEGSEGAAPAPTPADEPTPAPAPLVTPAAEPAWMQAPTGQPLATAFSLPKVDLADMKRAAAGMAAPATASAPLGAPLGGPIGATPNAAPLCMKCRTPLAADDKFCRNCGTRVSEGVALHTSQLPAAKLGALPSPVIGAASGATALMPAFRSVGVDARGSGPHAVPSMTMVFGAVSAERSAKLVLVRGQSAFGSQWRIQAGESSIGRSVGVILFPDDVTLAAEHARLRFAGDELILEPLPSQNGVFVRVKEPTRVEPGDEIVLGAQRFVVMGDADRPAAGVLQDGTTRALGSLVKPQPPITLLRVSADPLGHEVYHRCQRLLTLGRTHCDLNFPRDSFVSERHAQLSRTDEGTLLLEDLRSRNGTYLRARKPMRLMHGDLILMSDKVLRVEMPQR